jgi:hypothetical protein
MSWSDKIRQEDSSSQGFTSNCFSICSGTDRPVAEPEFATSAETQTTKAREKVATYAQVGVGVLMLNQSLNSPKESL